jgi:hypothetical protein
MEILINQLRKNKSKIITQIYQNGETTRKSLKESVYTAFRHGSRSIIYIHYIHGNTIPYQMIKRTRIKQNHISSLKLQNLQYNVFLSQFYKIVYTNQDVWLKSIVCISPIVAHGSFKSYKSYKSFDHFLSIHIQPIFGLSKI